MQEVSTFRLYLLRGMYLIVAAGLAILIWPLMLDSPEGAEHMRGVVWSLLTGISLLALLGIRYPLRMLPLLLFELTWKTIWLLAIGVPLWTADAFTPGTRETWRDCLVGVALCLAVIPWGYVLATYVRAPGDRWRSAARSLASGDLA